MFAPAGDPISTALRVLIIDDSPDDRALVMRELGLEHLDLHVRQITEEQAFADALQGGNFDLVVTDSHLRWTDGLSVLRAVKARHPDVAVIMFTGTGNEELAVEAMQAGLDDYIRKTTKAAPRLRTAIRSALERAEARRGAVRPEARLHTLLNRLGVAVFRLAQDGRLLEANETFLSLLGLSSLQEAQRVDLTALSGVLPERYEEPFSFQRHELQLCRADGTPIRVSVTKTVGRTPTGERVIDGLLEEVAPLPGMPHTERRRWPRVEAHLEASVLPDGETSSGTAPNMSLGGVYMVLDRPVPIAENHPIQLGLVTEVGILEIRGRIHRIRAAPEPVAAAPERLGSGFAVEFDPLDETKKALLASLLDGLRERTASVKLTALLIPKPTARLLVEATAPSTAPPQPVEGQPGRPEPGSIVLPERRLVARGDVAIPVQVESSVGLHQARTTDLSATGAGLRLLTGHTALGAEQHGQRLVVRLLLTEAVPPIPASASGDIRDLTVPGEIVWGAPNGTESRTPRVGIRFRHDSASVQSTLAELVGKLLTFCGQADDRPDMVQILSRRVEWPTGDGRRIVASSDSSLESYPGAPTIIIAPGYGETKTDYVTLAYYLAANGFHVLRYDHTNHVGESDGEMAGATLSSMNQDLGTVLDYANRTRPTSPIVVIAANMMGRIALKRLAQDHRVALLVVLTGIMDMEAALWAHQENSIVTFLRSAGLGTTNLLGLNVDGDRFLSDAIKESYADLHTTIEDAKRLRTPTLFFAAERDPRTQPDAVKKVLASLQTRAGQLYLIPEALHRLQDNPRQTLALVRQVASCCVERVFPDRLRKGLVEPSLRTIGAQTRLERERARARHSRGKPALREFWQDHLDRTRHLANIPAYWHFLEQIARLAGPLERGERVLDPGCGNGDLGMLLLTLQAYRLRGEPGPKFLAPHYVGLDFVPSALTSARTRLAQASAEIQDKSQATVMAHPLLATTLLAADLDCPLPIRDNRFDRIVCNLVLGSLQDPLFTLREFVRVLSPGGKMVITSLKPQADLTQICRLTEQQPGQPEAIETARQMLISFGTIKQAERDGMFHSLTRQELALLLLASGAVQISVHSAFDDQAYLAVAEKPPR
jgi:DNA-binding response OmpR family regulator/alpha-beta hydrolase superfamily lysophospholipase/ubiquinone/menaquinone biosynthesis C-methylase UbiE